MTSIKNTLTDLKEGRSALEGKVCEQQLRIIESKSNVEQLREDLDSIQSRVGRKNQDPTAEMQQQVDNMNKRIDQIAKESHRRAAQAISGENGGEGGSGQGPNQISGGGVGGRATVPFNDFDADVLRNKIELCVQ